MKRSVMLVLAFCMLFSAAFSQKYLTKNGIIKFYSKASLEEIDATNNQVNSALDISTGNFVFKALMEGFEFKKALMQEHFNENYIESDQFPDAIFKGTVVEIKTLDFSKNGINNVTVEGDLTIHGVTKHIKEKGTLEKKNDNIIGKSVFNIAIKDYGIKVPSAVASNVAESVQVTVDVNLAKL